MATLSKRQAVDQAYLARFLAQRAKNPNAPSPFLPYKPPNAKSSQRPRIGIRHWKRLFLASNFGQGLPLGPRGHAEKLIERESKRKASVVEESKLMGLAWQHWPPARQSSTPNQQDQGGLEERNSYLKARGPYKGRNMAKAFKGHKWETAKSERLQEISTRLEKMPERIAEWKKVRLT